MDDRPTSTTCATACCGCLLGLAVLNPLILLALPAFVLLAALDRRD